MMTAPSSNGPTALLIAPHFFGYEAAISAELERQGVATTFMDERPSTSSIARAALRRARPLARKWIDRYYRKWLTDLASKRFDVILVIKGEVIPRWFLESLREFNPSARFAFYAWDSVENSKEFLQLLDLFDEAFTFDREDAVRHSRLTYHPFFFAPEYAHIETQTRPIRLAFVGTLHTNRHLITKAIFDSLSGSETRCFLYSPARWYFFLKKYLTREFSAVRWRDVSFTPMSREATAALFHSSHAVLDIHHPKQNGLSPRAFEVLASGCILVTTNSSIQLEPFFDSEHIIVIPSDIKELDPEQLAAQLDVLPTTALPPERLDDYTIQSWVGRIVLPATDWRTQTPHVEPHVTEPVVPDNHQGGCQ